jgi:thymidylate synthase
MAQITKDVEYIRNFIGKIEDMSSEHLAIETPLWPRDALEMYSLLNLQLLDTQNNKAHAEAYAKYYSPQRGGPQGDYRENMRDKINNVIDCLRKFPQSKRAVLTVPKAQWDHTKDAEAKCLRELHFYLEKNQQGEKVLCCSGFMRAQASMIFPKNIHLIGLSRWFSCFLFFCLVSFLLFFLFSTLLFSFFCLKCLPPSLPYFISSFLSFLFLSILHFFLPLLGTLMNHIAEQLGLKTGSYLHFVTTLTYDR